MNNDVNKRNSFMHPSSFDKMQATRAGRTNSKDQDKLKGIPQKIVSKLLEY